MARWFLPSFCLAQSLLANPPIQRKECFLHQPTLLRVDRNYRGRNSVLHGNTRKIDSSWFFVTDLYSRWKLALLYLAVTLMVCSWLYCWLYNSPLPPLQQFRFYILLMVSRSTWLNYLVSLLFCSCAIDAQDFCWCWALIYLYFFQKNTQVYI